MSRTDDAIKKAQFAVKRAPGVAARRTMLAIESELILGSPVDKGRFRSNWVAGTNAPNRAIVYTDAEAKAAEKNSLHPKPENWGAVRWSVLLREGAVRYYLSNNLPYAIAILAGHSDFAPPGWVDTRIRRGVRRAARGSSS